MEEIDPKIFLEELQKEKKIIEKHIKQLENSIIDNEAKYLLSTVNSGNILRGWEHIFTSKSNKINIGIQVKKAHISNNEKLFSQTFEFDKNPEEINNHSNKYLTSHHASNNNLRIDENKNINGGNININVDGISNFNHSGINKKHKKSVKNFVGLKRNRNNINLKSNTNNVQDEIKNY